MEVRSALNLTKKFDWSGKKYLFTVMKNVVEFSSSIGNSVFNFFFNFISMIIFLDSG